MSERLVKLVRDKVADNLDGSEVVYKEVDISVGIRELRKKLIEEAAEYVAQPDETELADVLEVIMALAEYDLNLSWNDILREAEVKRKSKGSFDEFIGMYVTVRERD